MRLIHAVGVSAVLLAAPRAGAPAPPPLLVQEASTEGSGLRLTLRLLGRTAQSAPLRVGDLLTIEIAVTNLAREALRVPMSDCARAEFRHERHYEGNHCGMGGSDASFGLFGAERVEAGKTATATRKGRPVYAGRGAVRASLRNTETQFRVGKWVPDPAPIWTGSLEVEIPIETSVEGFDCPQGDFELSHSTSWLDRVEALARVMESAPDQRAVSVLRHHWARTSAAPEASLTALERASLLHHLLVTARRGYGIESLDIHVAALAAAETPPEARPWALEGAGFALRCGVAHRAPVLSRGQIGHHLNVEVDPALRRTARAAVETVAADAKDPLHARAVAILKDPHTLRAEGAPSR